MTKPPLIPDEDLIESCASQSLQLLTRNLTPSGLLAATPGPASEARAYTRIFARDSALCALAMLASGDPTLEAGALASLDSLAAQQAGNGQIPKYVDPEGRDADFWYLGCIDATLWWLIAVAFARDQGRELPARWLAAVDRALLWARCQEHQKFFLLQQNEASDWADIMPRSGFVLYSNALWYHVKRLYGLPHGDATHYHFNHLFHPFTRDIADYRRARLLRHYARNRVKRQDLYLSFVNFSFFGEEGDVFGNLLAILLGLSGDAMGEHIIRTLDRAGVAKPFPVRTVCEPISPSHPHWRLYMGRHRQNLEHQYHNGGIWPFIGGFWVMVLAKLGKRELARHALAQLALANSLGDWRFTEWFHGKTLAPMGMAGQSWNAAAFLLARQALSRSVFG